MAIGAAEIKDQNKIAQWMPVLEAFEAGAWLYWIEDTVITVATIPQIHRNAQNRPHKDSGPAFVSMDLSLWFWNGVLVDEYIVDAPEKITIKKINAEKNTEVQRVMIERYGEVRYIEDSRMTPAAKDARFGDIYVTPIESGTQIRRG